MEDKYKYITIIAIAVLSLLLISNIVSICNLNNRLDKYIEYNERDKNKDIVIEIHKDGKVEKIKSNSKIVILDNSKHSELKEQDSDTEVIDNQENKDNNNGFWKNFLNSLDNKKNIE